MEKKGRVTIRLSVTMKEATLNLTAVATMAPAILSIDASVLLEVRDLACYLLDESALSHVNTYFAPQQKIDHCSIA